MSIHRRLSNEHLYALPAPTLDGVQIQNMQVALVRSFWGSAHGYRRVSRSDALRRKVVLMKAHSEREWMQVHMQLQSLSPVLKALALALAGRFALNARKNYPALLVIGSRPITSISAASFEVTAWAGAEASQDRHCCATGDV
jgi:hypothetical protein